MNLSGYTFRGESEAAAELRLRNGQLISLRWMYVSLLTGTAIITGAIAHLPQNILINYTLLLAVGLVINLIFYLFNRIPSRHVTYYRALAVAQLLLDLIISTAALITQGGVRSRTIIIYVIPMLSAGLLFSSRLLVYLVASLAAVSYSASVVIVMANSAAGIIWSELLVPIVFYSLLFVVIARILLYMNRGSLAITRDQAYEELLAMLTHQLRHPASTMSAIIDTLEVDKTLKLDKKTKRYISMLRKENFRSLHLINNLLESATPFGTYSRDEKVDLNRLVAEATHLTGLASHRQKDMVIQLPQETVTMMANSEKVRMAIENVIDNALRYSKKGSQVIVSLVNSPNYHLIAVTDHGAGMTEDQKQNLIQKFTKTTTPEGESHGAGLGLYIAKRVAEAYGGKLEIISSPNQGTTITISLAKDKS